MSGSVNQDQLAVIRVEGMHCHKCERAIQTALSRHAGVHEVEVDFASGQVSVLYDRNAVAVREMMDTINAAGYKATGFSQRQMEHPSQG